MSFLTGVSESGDQSHDEHRSIVEGIYLIWAEYQPDDSGEADTGAVEGLHECQEGGQGVRGRHARSEQVQPQRATNREPGRGQASGTVAQLHQLGKVKSSAGRGSSPGHQEGHVCLWTGLKVVKMTIISSRPLSGFTVSQSPRWHLVWGSLLPAGEQQDAAGEGGRGQQQEVVGRSRTTLWESGKLKFVKRWIMIRKDQ